MAATGKKSKKAKWIPASITDIIAEPTTIPTTNSWADSVDEEPENFGYASRSRAPVVLPSASRAARGGMAVDDDAIPRRPPFVAHISNLPYDVDESAISMLFEGLKIINLRLPREGDRLKGYGYVDFEDRDSLINAMNMADPTVGGRRIRIEVSTQDNDRRRMGGRNDRDREYDPERTMGDWRSGPRAAPEPAARRPERDFTRGGDITRDRDRDITRDRDRDRDRDSSADNKPGAWRDGERAEPPRAAYGGRDSFGRDRDRDRDRGFAPADDSRRERGYGRDGERSGYGGRDGFRTAERDGFGSRDSRGFGSRGFGDRDRDRDPPPREDAKPRERPKLNLLPRTVPVAREGEPAAGAAGAAGGARPDGAADAGEPARAAPKPVPAEKVFGAAKPVDTAAKEREIEERLRKQEEEARRATEEKERWGRRNDHSDDRRGGARRDDRGRDSRSYNRDRRDYSKDDKDRRDYSKDDRDRRERDDKDRERPRDRDDRPRDRDDRARDRDDRPRDRDDRPRNDREPERARSHSGSRSASPPRGRPASPPRGRPASPTSGRPASPPRGRPAREPRESRGEAREERNGRARRSRSPEQDADERPMPKLKEQEKPNFVASNKFSFLEDADDAASD